MGEKGEPWEKMRTFSIRYGKFVLNKYFVAFFIFSVWVVFFDEASLVRQYEITSMIEEKHKEIEYYSIAIKEMEEAIKKLYSDPVFLEKYVRTRYFMRRKHEDVFIIRKEMPEQ